MSESIQARMKRVLNATGAYRLTGSSSADWELNACAAGLEQLDRAIDGLLADLFPATASPQRLTDWEALFQPQPGTGPTGDRQKTSQGRLAENPSRFTPEEFPRVLHAAGVAGDLLENGDALTVVVGKRLGLPEEECRRELDLTLPAHLGWTWLEEMNWAALNAWSAPFSELDARGRTWAQWDAMTKTQLETEEN